MNRPSVDYQSCLATDLDQYDVLIFNVVVLPTDEATVSSLKNLRLTADDFEVKSIIGRGHFGEVCV